MPHLRTQIRYAVRDLLLGLPLTADRVFVGRTRPLAANHPPTLLIYSAEATETAQRAVMGARPKLDRAYSLMIEGRVSASDPPDDMLDEIAAAVEGAMWISSAALQALMYAHDRPMLGPTVQTVEAGGASHVGGIRLEYLIRYRNDEGAPEIAT